MSGLWHKGDGIYVSAYHFLVVKWRLGVFGLGATVSLSFGNLLFYYRQEFPRFFLPVLICHLSQLARYGWIFICWDEIITIYLTENVKIFLIFTLVFKTWATFPDLGRNTLVFCYYWWVVIKQSHIHCHHQYQTEMQQEIWQIQSTDDECDVVYGVTLISENLCTFPYGDRLVEWSPSFLAFSLDVLWASIKIFKIFP